MATASGPPGGSAEAEARKSRRRGVVGGRQRLTVQRLRELLTRRQPALQQPQVVGAVVQVVGQDPVHSQGGQPQQPDHRELVGRLWGTRGRAGRRQRGTV